MQPHPKKSFQRHAPPHFSAHIKSKDVGVKDTQTQRNRAATQTQKHVAVIIEIQLENVLEIWAYPTSSWVVQNTK